MEITGLEDRLRTVVSCCEEFCARADKLMGYTRECYGNWTNLSAMERLDSRERTQRERPWLFSFTPMRKTFQAITPTLNQGKASYFPATVGLEKQDKTIDSTGQDLVQQAISIRDRGRAALPDEDLPHQICDLSNGLCFLLGTLICPSLTWLTLRSLDLESASALDQRILTYVPFTAALITSLGYHRSIALTAATSSIIAGTGATALPVWRSCMRGRSSAFVSCWLLIAVGSLVWSLAGGSVTALFLVFMPCALEVGVASGLLWHKQMSRPL